MNELTSPQTESSLTGLPQSGFASSTRSLDAGGLQRRAPTLPSPPPAEAPLVSFLQPTIGGSKGQLKKQTLRLIYGPTETANIGRDPPALHSRGGGGEVGEFVILFCFL